MNYYVFSINKNWKLEVYFEMDKKLEGICSVK
jgi:hypothetical protein